MWVVFSLLTSVISAVYDLCNQNSKLKAEVFIIYRGLLVAMIATPLALIYFHIFPWQFYAIAVLQGFCISYLDYKYFQTCQKFGAENVKGLWSLTVFFTFILWFLLKPETILTYIETPARSLVITASLLLMIFAMTKLSSDNKVSRNFLSTLLPILCLASLIDISNKLIMTYNDGYVLPLTFHRVAITGWIIGIVNLLANSKKLTSYKELLNPKNLLQCWFIILIGISMICVNFAMYYTPNPAYASAISMLTVIWIIIFNKIKSYLGQETIYPSIGLKRILLLLFAAITLIISTQQ